MELSKVAKYYEIKMRQTGSSPEAILTLFYQDLANLLNEAEVDAFITNAEQQQKLDEITRLEAKLAELKKI